jgi:hypothetical protein
MFSFSVVDVVTRVGPDAATEITGPHITLSQELLAATASAPAMAKPFYLNPENRDRRTSWRWLNPGVEGLTESLLPALDYFRRLLRGPLYVGLCP